MYRGRLQGGAVVSKDQGLPQSGWLHPLKTRGREGSGVALVRTACHTGVARDSVSADGSPACLGPLWESNAGVLDGSTIGIGARKT